MWNVFTVLFTMPVATAAAERSFSVLLRVKTFLRTTMNQDRLSALGLMHIHREVPIDVTKVFTVLHRAKTENGSHFLKLIITDSSCSSYTPRERSSGGYIEITLSVRLSVRPSVCPSVCADSCPAHNFFMVWHWLTIFGTWMYHHQTMCQVHSWSRFNVDLWPQGQI